MIRSTPVESPVYPLWPLPTMASILSRTQSISPVRFAETQLIELYDRLWLTPDGFYFLRCFHRAYLAGRQVPQGRYPAALACASFRKNTRSEM